MTKSLLDASPTLPVLTLQDNEIEHRVRKLKGALLMTSPRISGAIAVLVALLVAANPSVTLAGYASSGQQYRETDWVNGYGYIRSCLEAVITTTSTYATNEGANYSRDNSGGVCDGAETLPAGWLGVTLDGYRDGSFCGTTNYYYSDSATAGFGVTTSLCSNPSGTQEFHTTVFGRIYMGAGYLDISGIAGPSQNG